MIIFLAVFGTVMADTTLLLTTWFLAIDPVSQGKNGIASRIASLLRAVCGVANARDIARLPRDR
ncbi:MAG: hypothetical protein R3E87_22170 [Burkholderiaceae bacterium]